MEATKKYHLSDTQSAVKLEKTNDEEILDLK